MTAPLFNVSGPVSGIDTNGLISAILAQRSLRKGQIEARVATNNARLTALADLRSKVTTLRTAAETLRSTTLFGGAASIGTGGLQATVTPSAGGLPGFTANVVGSGTPGTYGVEVLGLAQAAQLRSDTFADPNAALGFTGNLVVNGATTAIVAGDSLTTIAGKLSTSLAAFATVAVEQVGAGQFQLAVTHNTVGLGQTFVVTSTGAAPGARLGFQTDVFTQARVVQTSAQYRDEAGALAVATTLVTSLRTAGNVPLNYLVGDTIDVTVTDQNGLLQTNSLTVTATTRVQDVLGLMSSVVPGASNSVVSGRLRLTSDTFGPNGLSIVSVFAEKSPTPGGAIVTAGTAQSNTSPTVLAQVGQDASVRINGTTFTSSTNTGLTFASLPDLTLDLNSASVGGSSTLTVGGAASGTGGDNGLAASLEATRALVTAYNDIRDFIRAQTTTSGEDVASRPPLFSDPVLRNLRATLPDPFLSAIPTNDPVFNRLNTVGIELDRTGKLLFDEAKFTSGYTTNPSAVAALLRQTSTTVGTGFSVVALGTTSVPGTYEVSVSSLATQPVLNGSGFGGVYTGGTPPDALTIVDLRTGGRVEILITAGMTTAQIAAAINAAASTPVNEVRTFSSSFEDAVGVAATGATTFSDLRGAGGIPLGIAAGDKINFSGRRADGSTFAGAFAFSDPSTQTLDNLRSAVESSIGPSASVAIVNGQLEVTTLVGGASTTISMSSDNLGGGSLSFGTTSVTTIGRPALDVSAADIGGQLSVTSSNFGSASGLEIQFTDLGGSGPEQLGFTPGQTVFGTDIVGTIGGLSATGFGQQLSGQTGGATEGLVLQVTGSTLGLLGEVTMQLGAAAGLQRIANDILRSTTGVLDTRVARLDEANRQAQVRIESIDARVEAARRQLVQTFARMETAIAQFQSTGGLLTSFIANLNAPRRSS